MLHAQPNLLKAVQLTFSSDMSREELSDISELQAVKKELVEHDINVEPRQRLVKLQLRTTGHNLHSYSSLESSCIRRANEFGNESALDDQADHASCDASTYQFRSGKVVDDE